MLCSVKLRFPDLKVVYEDVYDLFSVHNPKKHGFEISGKGCYGTRMIQINPLCNKELRPGSSPS